MDDIHIIILIIALLILFIALIYAYKNGCVKTYTVEYSYMG